GTIRALANRIRLSLTHLALEISINEHPDLTVEDSLGIAHADVSSVISDHGIGRKDVGADAVAEACRRVLPLELGAFLSLGVHLPLEQPGAQDLQGRLAVLDLAPLVLARDDNSGWLVRQADG